MELKETIEELKLINEVNTKSLNELADEYLSNEEDANEFLQKYGFIFLRKPLYQLRVADKYEKILELFNYGNLMYPNEDNDFFDHNIKTMINYNLKAYDLRSKTDDLSQAQILFSNSLGADKCRKIPSFEELISRIYDASIKYDLKGKYSIEDYRTFLEVTTQQTFYMINKTDNLILFISSSLNDTFKQQYLNEENKENLSIKFKNIYNNLIDVKNKENKESNILYIPSFEIKCKLENNCFTNVEDGTDKYNLYCFEDYYNVKYW